MFKKSKRTKCSLCKTKRVSKESAIVKMQCADGIVEMIVCDECLGYMSPMISNADL